MKKLIGISIAVLMVLSISTLSWADARSTDKAIGVTIIVADVFGFTIDYTSFTLKPGEFAPDPANPGQEIYLGVAGFNLWCSSNRGNPWSIKVASLGCFPEGDLGGTPVQLLVTTYTIADEVYGATNAASCVQDLKLTADPQTIYASGADEQSAFGLKVHGNFVPENQATIPVGRYMGTVNMTMTE